MPKPDMPKATSKPASNSIMLSSANWGKRLESKIPITQKNKKKPVLYNISIGKKAIHLYTDDNENVRIIPRAQITEVDLIDTDHKTMKKILPSQLATKLCCNLLIDLVAGLIALGVSYYYYPTLWIEIVSATLWVIIAMSSWLISGRLYRSKAVYEELIEKGSKVTITTATNTITFLMDDTTMDEHFQVFLDDPSSQV